MLRTITTKTIRDGRRSLFWWSIGLVGLTVLTVATYPAVRDMPGMEDLLEGLPEAILALIGESDLLSPAGYLNSQLFGAIVPLLFLFYGVAAGAGAIAGEEENRTLDLLLSNPVSRTRVLLEKALAMVIGLLLLGAILWLATYLPGLAVDMDLDPANLVAVVVSAALFGFFMGGFALMVGASTRLTGAGDRPGRGARDRGLPGELAGAPGGRPRLAPAAVAVLLLLRRRSAPKRARPGPRGGPGRGWPAVRHRGGLRLPAEGRRGLGSGVGDRNLADAAVRWLGESALAGRVRPAGHARRVVQRRFALRIAGPCRVDPGG